MRARSLGASAPFVGVIVAAALVVLVAAWARSGADPARELPIQAAAALSGPPDRLAEPMSFEPAAARAEARSGPIVSAIDPMLIPEPTRPTGANASATDPGRVARTHVPVGFLPSSSSVLERPIAPPD